MAELADIVLAVAQHHGIEAAFRRLVADQKREAFFLQHLIDRAQPVGAFGVSRRR